MYNKSILKSMHIMIIKYVISVHYYLSIKTKEMLINIRYNNNYLINYNVKTSSSLYIDNC